MLEWCIYYWKNNSQYDSKAYALQVWVRYDIIKADMVDTSGTGMLGCTYSLACENNLPRQLRGGEVSNVTRTRADVMREVINAAVPV